MSYVIPDGIEVYVILNFQYSNTSSIYIEVFINVTFYLVVLVRAWPSSTKFDALGTNGYVESICDDHHPKQQELQNGRAQFSSNCIASSFSASQQIEHVNSSSSSTTFFSLLSLFSCSFLLSLTSIASSNELARTPCVAASLL